MFASSSFRTLHLAGAHFARPSGVRAALVVQDDPSLGKAMTNRLGRMQFSVLHAKHFDAAVSHLGTTEPHVVCIDVRLPSRSGYQLCEHIRCSLKLMHVPILLIGERGHAEELAYAEDVGGNAFLRKPFSMQHFAHCVEALLGTWSRTRGKGRGSVRMASRG
jgi:DNA-binding response OmpR family regulator